ncbi:MAG: prolipoprotein diacylglyceryl transferase [bacterium P3]|nr:MAG: prolipoprotein diacylglyceryl transferase [bacterium P3]KWW41099.1 MAG: prolipoprotein diacylglyceryl transferase [bacterium F083]
MPLQFIRWNVDPVMLHLGGFSLRWYSIGFLLAFLIGYCIFYRMCKRENVAVKYLDNLVLYVFVATLAGARLGHCLFYEPDYFLTAAHWPEIFLPFNLHTGEFTGYQGLASHGAAIAILLAIWLYNRRFHVNVWWLLDRLVIIVALAGCFIRLGNLMNSEIYGIETSLPWGFIYERNLETVPKHPTQLYEAACYLLIFIVTYAVYLRKNGRMHNGRLFGWWLVALFGARFLIEFVKEEQVAFEKGMSLDMGQWLSLPFIAAGAVIVVLSYRGMLADGIFDAKANRDNTGKKH